MVKSKENLVGAYAFLVGVILAILFGFFTETPETAGNLFYSVLILIGIIIGFAKESDKSSVTFLLASLSIVIVTALGTGPLVYISVVDNYVVTVLRNILTSLSILFVPVTIIVALKTVFSIANI